MSLNDSLSTVPITAGDSQPKGGDRANLLRLILSGASATIRAGDDQGTPAFSFFEEQKTRRAAMYTPQSTDKTLTYLSEILDVLRSTNQHEQVLHLIVDRLVRIYHCQVCAIVLIDKNTEYLRIENSHGLSWTFCKEFKRKFATGCIGKLLWTGKPVFMAEPTAPFAEEMRLEHTFGSCVAVQIAVDQRTLGYLYADSQQLNAFLYDDVNVFQAFANAAAIALRKAQLHDENLHLDKIDHETGIEKYEAFIERMRECVNRADKFGEYFSVVLLDVDNFKTLIKTYGYDTSRLFLRELGELVRQEVRTIDATGRYGFDELIILLAKSNLDQALAFSRRLARVVEEHQFTHHRFSSTISIGVASYPENGRTLEALITTAKNALFEAQRSGRNNVFHYNTEWDAADGMLCNHA